MKERLKASIVCYVLCFAIAGGLAYVYVSLREFELQPLLEQYRILCDAFTVPGVLFLMLGCLLSISHAGALDGIGFALSYMIQMLIPGDRGKQERYYDYVQRKKASRKGGFGCLYVVGLVFLAIALIFLVLFYSLYQN